MTVRAHGLPSTTRLLSIKPRVAADACAGGAGQRIGQQFANQAERGNRQKAGEHEEHASPAEEIAEDTARGLTEQLSGDLAGEIARQHLLPPLVGHDVADKGHPHRHEPGREHSATQCAPASAWSGCR